MKNLVLSVFSKVFSRRTVRSAHHDVVRFRARRRPRPALNELPDSLHLGCGSVRVEGWLNVDVSGSDFDIDLSCGSIPFPDNSFFSIAAQHLIEHLELEKELIPLFKELSRISKEKGELWLSCPDMEKICSEYLEDGGKSLIQDRLERFPEFDMGNTPPQHMVNLLFHQGGSHVNLFDFELLRWALNRGGFNRVERVTESDFLRRFPEFPARNDDFQSLYVHAAPRMI